MPDIIGNLALLHAHPVNPVWYFADVGGLPQDQGPNFRVLVRGLELSVEDGGQGCDLPAYEPDTDHRALREVLVPSVEARDERIPAPVAKIAPVVPALRLENVLAIAGSVIPG